jgi:stringent starvation protein B
MTPSKPYIVRAIYDWIVDNGCTPHVLVEAADPSVIVPPQYVVDDQIVLNISPSAVVGLHLGNDAITFNGRFGGAPMDIYLPVHRLLAIYARENGQGMVFDANEPPPEAPEPTPHKPSKPSLKVIK